MLNTKLSVCDPFQKADTRFLPNLCILDATPDTVINIGTWECSRFFNLDQILSGKQLSWSCFKNPYLQYALESPMASNSQAFSEQSSENECVCVWMCSIHVVLLRQLGYWIQVPAMLEKGVGFPHPFIHLFCLVHERRQQAARVCQGSHVPCVLWWKFSWPPKPQSDLKTK